MKLLHLADLHFGKAVNKLSMLAEQRELCKRVVALVRERNVDAVLLAGDIYDTRTPSEEAVALFDHFLQKLAETGTAVLLISGNHDSAERLGFGRSFFKAHRIYFTGSYQGELLKLELSDEYGPVDFYLLPFVRKSALDFYLKGEKGSFPDYDTAVRAALAGAPQAGRRSVLLAHQFVTTGGAPPETAGSETSHINVGTLDNISSDCFDGFDYVALGHIHNAQALGRESCRYAGTLLRYDISEIDRPDKTIPLVTLDAKGFAGVELIPVQPLHEMLHLTDSFENIIRQADTMADKEAYLYVTLTDQLPIPDAMHLLQQKYPNILKLDYQHTLHRAAPEAKGEVKRERSFDELIQDFYKLVLGKDAAPTEEEMELLHKAAEETGVL